MKQTIITPERANPLFDISEIWKYRELFYFFAWRDVKVRYKQTLLGFGWAILQPLMTMIVFSIFLGRTGRIPTDGHPYPIFVLSGLVPWLYFSNSINFSSNSVYVNRDLVKKVYFPKLILPISSIFVGCVELLISTLFLLILLPLFKVPLSFRLIALPFFYLLVLSITCCVSFSLSALVALYRDFRYLTAFLLQLWLFVSPVVYPLELIPENWQLFYSLNPMVSIIMLFRWIVFHSDFLWPQFTLSILSSIMIGILGLKYFQSMEIKFADYV